MSDAARVRVLGSVNSPLRGQVLTVVDVKVKERMGTTKVSYLCEMPGYEHPGWFRESEVEVVD